MTLKEKSWLTIGLTVCGLVIFSSLIVTFDLDRRLAAALFDEELLWPHGLKPFWQFMEDHGTWPGMILLVFSLVAAVASGRRAQWRSWRKYWWLVFLTGLIAAGLIGNVVLKDHWGRPRPREIQAFDGPWEYRHFHQPGRPGRGKSFVSGDAAMGFIFVTFFFFRRKSKRLAYVGGTAGVIWGSVVSAGRFTLGAHFLTDALWALGLVVLTASVLYYHVLKIPWPEDETFWRKLTPAGRFAWGLVLVTVAAYAAMTFFWHRPYYRTDYRRLALPDDPRRIEITANVDLDRSEVVYWGRDQARLSINSAAVGGSNVDVHLDEQTRTGDGVLYLDYRLRPEGRLENLEHGLTLYLPDHLVPRPLVVVVHPAG
jgi:membrane-associated PAP2 superfamily phosphatase